MATGNQYRFEIGDVLEQTAHSTGTTIRIIDRWPLNGGIAEREGLPVLYRYRVYRSDKTKHNFDEAYLLEKCRLMKAQAKSDYGSLPMGEEVLEDIPTRLPDPLPDGQLVVIVCKPNETTWRVEEWPKTLEGAELAAERLASAAVSDRAIGTAIFVAKTISGRRCVLPPPSPPPVPRIETTKYK